jgi:putative transposase
MDFVSGTLSGGRRFRTLTVVDCHSRECLVLAVDISLNGERVVRVLEWLTTLREAREAIEKRRNCYNGSGRTAP